MSKTMRAARMHATGEDLRIDTIDVPEPGPTDVLVEVRACGIVPNLRNVLDNITTWFPHLVMPELPAIFGLDAAGVVVRKGSQVHGVELGQRVYVNPARYCGGCRPCRAGDHISCAYYTFNGYFGFGPGSKEIYKAYPYGGLADYMTAPQYSLVDLPDSVSFETAARWGYLGTAYRALRRAGAGPHSTLLVNGASGTLGIGAVLFGLALGVREIYGTGRDLELLKQVEALAPGRIRTHALGDEVSVTNWVHGLTGGVGTSIVVDALGPGAPQSSTLDAFGALARGGTHVNIGAVAGELPINLHEVMDRNQTLVGSLWFTPTDGQEMADLAAVGAVDLSVLEHEVFGLERVNEALAVFKNRNGGFSNYVIVP
ncbi:alcohol dehydrogenase catalytic domain-containing protein [Kineococcus sp. LSe6-4]|uniref:Alcohol dehydrogenase catalytic domain-containing protein n=1 Tax=Kineococcus halophytocola TaxID=3234027 RepID=A0ABV4H422_9ACTN